MSDFPENTSNGRISMDVLDRFLNLVKENNDSYGSMTSAVDAMSAKMLEISDRIQSFEDTIEAEQLSDAVRVSYSDIRKLINGLREDIGMLQKSVGEPTYNILKSICDYLEFKKTSETVVQEIGKSVIWFIGLVTFIRNHILIITFVSGVAAAFVLGSSGLSLWDFIKVLIK